MALIAVLVLFLAQLTSSWVGAWSVFALGFALAPAWVSALARARGFGLST